MLDLGEGGLVTTRQSGNTPMGGETYVWIAVVHEGVQLLHGLPHAHAQLLPLTEMFPGPEVVLDRLLGVLLGVKVLDPVARVRVVSEDLLDRLGGGAGRRRVNGSGVGVDGRVQGFLEFGGIDLGRGGGGYRGDVRREFGAEVEREAGVSW